VPFRYNLDFELIDLDEARIFLVIEGASYQVRLLTGLNLHTNQAGEITRIGTPYFLHLNSAFLRNDWGVHIVHGGLHHWSQQSLQNGNCERRDRKSCRLSAVFNGYSLNPTLAQLSLQLP